MAEVIPAAVPTFATGRLARRAGIVGVIFLILTAIGVALEPSRALLGYLYAYCTVFAVAAGALILMLIGHAANTRWLSPPRRIVEAVFSVFPLLLVMFIPIAIGTPWIYSWANPEILTPHAREMVEKRAGWLEVAPFITRGFGYLLIFAYVAEWLRRWSLRRDHLTPAGDPEDQVRPERRFASASIPFVGLALTFASFDWIMSLQPDWPSTMFGVYIFGGGFVAALALVSILGWQLVKRHAGVLTGNHFHALGRMLLAFVIFWAYAAYFQAFLIQIADKPVEVTFYITRVSGGWYGVLWAIILTRFVVPFFLLLPRAAKHVPGYIAAIAIMILVGHVIEMYWIVIPVSGEPHGPIWSDFTALIGVVASCIGFAAWRMHGVPIVSAGDPFLAAGRLYKSPT